MNENWRNIEKSVTTENERLFSINLFQEKGFTLGRKRSVSLTKLQCEKEDIKRIFGNSKEKAFSYYSISDDQLLFKIGDILIIGPQEDLLPHFCKLHKKLEISMIITSP